MSKKVKAILITITIIVFVLVFMGAKYLSNFISKELGDMCGNDIKQKISSPNGENIAYIFERSCGATTGFSPQLSILDKDDDFQNKSGNTFRANKDFSIEWLDNKHLKVIHNKSSETYKMDKKVNGIEIEYVNQ